MLKKKAEITLEQMAEAVTEVTCGERLKPLIAKAPILMLAFSVFGAELTRILFEEKEENKNE